MKQQKKQYTITANLDDHEGYTGQPVQIVENLPGNFFTVKDKDGKQWHCGEEELTLIPSPTSEERGQDPEQDCKEAIQALKNGEWNNPQLLAVGYLHPSHSQREKQVKEFYGQQAERVQDRELEEPMPDEIHNGFTDEENYTHIDFYKAGEEKGETVAIVCQDTGKVYFLDNIYRTHSGVLEAIKEVTPTPPAGKEAIGEQTDWKYSPHFKDDAQGHIFSNDEDRMLFNMIAPAATTQKQLNKDAKKLITAVNAYPALVKENGELKRLIEARGKELRECRELLEMLAKAATGTSINNWPQLKYAKEFLNIP